MPRRFTSLAATAFMASLLTAVCARAEAPRFERDILPIFTAHCLKCHGADARKGGLDLRTPAALLQGGTNGPVLVAGAADKSLLFEQVAKKVMPPDKAPKLSDAQIALVRRWIDAGAPGDGPRPDAEPVSQKDRQFWSFRPLARPAVARAREAARVRTPVDAFLLARLEEKGLTFSADADRAALARRTYFDLLGLPPSPEEVQTFVADPRPDAYERLLDMLLASPHFGERWGRHWLDQAGYVDVLGVDNDAGTVKLGDNKWRYRDYVVRAINEDRPFDRFLTEQLAGDELADWRSAKTFTPRTRELLIATGFLRVAPDDTDENELNTPDIRHAVLQKTGETLASNLLALTVGCAKCHDHKYEPIPQRDYYRLLACLAPAFDPQAWLQPKKRALPDSGPAEHAALEAHNMAIAKQVAKVTERKADRLRPHEERLRDKKLATLPPAIRADTWAAVQTPADKRNEVRKYLADKLGPLVQVSPQEVRAALVPADREAIEVLDREIAELNGQRRGGGHLQVVYDVGAPTPVRLLRRGNHETPGDEVRPGIPSVLAGSDLSALLRPGEARPAGATSGRRLALARRLTDWQSPAGALVARVRVNRVWQQLFGRGLAATSDNLGVSGARPTHPELLEWLASESVRNGGRLKPLLKLLMTSTAYRQESGISGQQSAVSASPPALDPDNRLLWRMRLRRLESESVRDALLAVAGDLDRTPGGAPVGPEQPRRSLYLVARRNYHPTLLNVFDQPIVAVNCTCRTPSAVVLQSLTMLNDDFVVRQAGRLADRVARERPADARQQIERAFQVVLSRPPAPRERAWCLESLEKQAGAYRDAKLPPERAAHKALTHLCQVLLNTSEFLYVP